MAGVPLPNTSLPTPGGLRRREASVPRHPGKAGQYTQVQDAG